jgi:hypothetical protein
MGHSRTPTPNTAGDGFPADPIDGSAYVLPPFTLTQRDAVRPCSPPPTSGAVGVSNLLVCCPKPGMCDLPLKVWVGRVGRA